MEPTIHIQPAEVWDYHKEERSRLEEELVEIASNEETKTSVYITDENGYPVFYVYRDDKKIFQSECCAAFEAERNLRVIYAQYLSRITVVGKEEKSAATADNGDDSVDSVGADHDDDDVDLPPCTDLDAMSDEEFEKYVSEREDVIIGAVCDLIDVLTEDATSAVEFGMDDEETCIEDVVDRIVEYLAIKCGFCIRRPMAVVDDDSGKTVRTEYPYEEFDFGDGELSTAKETGKS